MDTSSEILLAFVVENFYNLVFDNQGGRGIKFPDYDLFAQDYLGFAENELKAYQAEENHLNRTASLINCIAHLKRAIECQLDTFLFAYGMLRKAGRKNLSVDQKLEFIKNAGIFTARSISRLNLIRNKMEHEYEVPAISEIELFFDLTAAFVAILHAAIYVLRFNDITFSLEDEENNYIGSLKLLYLVEKPSLRAEIAIGGESIELEESLDEFQEFTKMFRIWYLLQTRDGFASDAFVLARLSTTYEKTKIDET